MAPSATPAGPHRSAGAATENYEDIRAMADRARSDLLTNGLSRSMSHAMKRGENLAERKAAWPFDYYQVTGLYPVDYKYWSRKHKSQLGDSELITMHASCYTASLIYECADQVFHRGPMSAAHGKAMKTFREIEDQLQVGISSQLLGQTVKEDRWGALKKRITEGTSALTKRAR